MPRDNEKEKQLMENPVEFMMDFFIDMVKAFKEGFTGQSQEQKDPQKKMEDMMAAMTRMMEGMQKMQMQQMQSQMKQMGNPQPVSGNMGPAAGNRQTQANMQMPNMQMPNMQMPNMQMPNMQMPNMQGIQMPNMQMPNMQGMQMPNQQMSPDGMLTGMFMQMMQVMMTGMMQYMQMSASNMQQMQNRQQAPEKEKAPEKEQKAPEKQGPEQAIKPSPGEQLENELIDSTAELGEATRSYQEIKAENDALKAELKEEVDKNSRDIEKAQNEMDGYIQAISDIKAKKDTTLQQEREELNNEIQENLKDVQKVTEDRESIKSEKFDPDAVQWSEESLENSELSMSSLDTNGMDRNAKNAVTNYDEAVRDYRFKMVAGSVNAEDTIKTYDAAKQFLDATKPKMKEITEGENKGKILPETQSPELQKAREDAGRLVSELEGMKQEKIRERAGERAEARKDNKEFSASATKDIKWFSNSELDKAISSLDRMKDSNGNLSPGAEKFKNALTGIKENSKSTNGINAGAYVDAYKAADDFMQESIRSGKSGPEVNAVRQAAKDVRKRLNDNNRIDKLKIIDSFEKKQQMLREKDQKLAERESAQAKRNKDIEKLKTDMRKARGERDRLNTDKHKENKRRLEESDKKLEAAKIRRTEAVNRRRNAVKNSDRHTRTMQQPQKRPAGMGM